jgi:hypothetical protein
MRHGFDGCGEEHAAGIDFNGQGLVLGRHAVDRIADPAVDQLQSVVWPGLVGAFRKPVFEQGRIEQVAGVIAGERPSSAIGAL